METKQNRFVLSSVRADLRQYGRVIYLPDDMSEADIERAIGEDLKNGIIKQVKRIVTGADKGAGQAPGVAGRKAAAAGAYDEYPAPPSIQLFVQSVGAGVAGNGVSPGRWGPCMLEHVELFSYVDGGALNMPQVVAVHLSSSPDVGPLGGEMMVLEYADPQNLLGVGEGAGEVFYKQRVDTAVGSRVYPRASYFPRLTIPWRTFYVNVTVKGVNHPASVFVTCDFGPLVIAAAKAGKTVAVEPRVTTTSKSVSVPKAAAVPKSLETMLFKSYVQMKEFEALGNRIVWSSVKNTGDPVTSISASVVVGGGASLGGRLPYAAPTILAGGEERELAGIIRP